MGKDPCSSLTWQGEVESEKRANVLQQKTQRVRIKMAVKDRNWRGTMDIDT